MVQRRNGPMAKGHRGEEAKRRRGEEAKRQKTTTFAKATVVKESKKSEVGRKQKK
jgi:hypothetical protein